MLFALHVLCLSFSRRALVFFIFLKSMIENQEDQMELAERHTWELPLLPFKLKTNSLVFINSKKTTNMFCENRREFFILCFRCFVRFPFLLFFNLNTAMRNTLSFKCCSLCLFNHKR